MEHHSIARHLVLLAIGVISFSFMYPVQLSGDENHYVGSSRLIAEYLSGIFTSDGTELSTLLSRIRGIGWFMPGMSVLLTPVSLIFGPDSPIWMFRLWVLLINLTLMSLICRELQHRYKPAAGYVFLIVCAASPYLVSFIATAWGSMITIFLTILVLLKIDDWRLNIFSTKSAVMTGIALAIIVYLRGMYFPVIVLVVVAFFLLALREPYSNTSGRKTIILHVATIFITVVILISPWSIFVSKIYGPTITTTSTKLSQIVAFGHYSVVQELNSEGGYQNRFHSIQRAVAMRAKYTGHTLKEQYEIEYQRALAPVSNQKLIKKLATNTRRYLWNPEKFLSRFERSRCDSVAGCAPGLIMMVAHKVTMVSWFICAIFLFVYMLVPFKFSDNSYWLPLFGKGMIFLFLIHCFVATTHGRYYVQLFPIAGVIAGILFSNPDLRESVTRFPAKGAHDMLVYSGQIIGAFFALLIVLLQFL